MQLPDSHRTPSSTLGSKAGMDMRCLLQPGCKRGAETHETGDACMRVTLLERLMGEHFNP